MPSIDPLIFPFEMNAKPTYSKGKKRGKNLTSQCTTKGHKQYDPRKHAHVIH